MAKLTTSIVYGNLTVTSGGNLTVDGAVTGSNLNISNWDTAYGDKIDSVSGTGNTTLTLTRQDGGTVTTNLSHDHGNAQYTDTTYTAGSGLTLTGTEFSLTGDSFNASGTYANLRAQATNKGDVGLGNVLNEEQVPKSGGSFTGNVGIGTTGPSEALDIESDDNNTYMRIGHQGAGNAGIYLFSSCGETPGSFSITKHDSNNFTRFRMHDGDSPHGDDFLCGYRDQRVYMPGNVGIGTTSPSSKLEVNGNITASNIGTAADRDCTISTSGPSGGANGDVWYKY